MATVIGGHVCVLVCLEAARGEVGRYALSLSLSLSLSSSHSLLQTGANVGFTGRVGVGVGVDGRDLPGCGPYLDDPNDLR